MVRDSARTAAAAVAAVLALAPPAYAAVTAPKSGTYKGETSQAEKVTLIVSKQRVQVMGFGFDCGRKSKASTSVQDLKLARTDTGYRFATSANGIVSYADGQPDQNGRIDVRGRFSKSGKSVRGILRVETKRCHSTGYLRWSASR